MPGPTQGARFEADPEALAPAVDALARGVPATEEETVLAEVADALGGDLDGIPNELATPLVRRAVLRAAVDEPALRERLEELDAWLDPDEVHVERGRRIGAWWALPAAGFDVEQATEEARLFDEAYPFEGRILGDVDERAARWLGDRFVYLGVTPQERLPAVRRAIATLAEAAGERFPRAARSIGAAAEDLDDGPLWFELALRIVQRDFRPATR